MNLLRLVCTRKRVLSWKSLAISASLLIVIATACNGTAPAEEISTVSEPDLSLHPVYSTYDFGHEDNVIDIGIQPLWIPPGIITSVMIRDAVLQRALSESGMELRFHAFLKGTDVNFFLKRGDLEVAIGGDMPALTAAATSDVMITTFMQYGFSSIVAKRYRLMPELKGKRIGYPFGSNAHFALLNSLSAIGLSEDDVNLIPLDVNEMPVALDEGLIDAFTAWEPTPTITITLFPKTRIVQRSITTGYLYFSAVFANQYPIQVKHIIASELRALNWLKDNKNLIEASNWALLSGQILSGNEPVLSPESYALIAKDDLLSLTNMAFIPERLLEPNNLLFKECIFLQSIGRIPSSIEWESVRLQFNLDLAREVRSRADYYQLENYDYSATLAR